jgi:hypothetical protein
VGGTRGYRLPGGGYPGAHRRPTYDGPALLILTIFPAPHFRKYGSPPSDPSLGVLVQREDPLPPLEKPAALNPNGLGTRVGWRANCSAPTSARASASEPLSVDAASSPAVVGSTSVSLGVLQNR